MLIVINTVINKCISLSDDRRRHAAATNINN